LHGYSNLGHTCPDRLCEKHLVAHDARGTGHGYQQNLQRYFSLPPCDVSRNDHGPCQRIDRSCHSDAEEKDVTIKGTQLFESRNLLRGDASRNVKEKERNYRLRCGCLGVCVVMDPSFCLQLRLRLWSRGSSHSTFGEAVDVFSSSTVVRQSIHILVL